MKTKVSLNMVSESSHLMDRIYSVCTSTYPKSREDLHSTVYTIVVYKIKRKETK